VPFYRLTDTPLPAVKLHRALDFECRRICCIARNADEHEPFLVGSDAVVDYLGTTECRVAVEYLLRRRRLVGNCPVENGRFGDHSDSSVRDPFPENHVRIVDMRLDLLLSVNVKYLQSPSSCGAQATSAMARDTNAQRRRTFESQNLLGGMHNGGFGGNGSP
jgi:hypothetical protein